MVSEKSPNPVRSFRPTKISEPTPAAEQTRHQHHLHGRPPEPDHLHEEERAVKGDPSNVAMAAKLPAPPMTTAAIAGRVSLDQVDCQDAEPTPDGDQRRFRAEHHAEAEGGEGRNDDTEQIDRRDRAARLKSFEGSWPLVPGR